METEQYVSEMSEETRSLARKYLRGMIDDWFIRADQNELKEGAIYIKERVAVKNLNLLHAFLEIE